MNIATWIIIAIIVIWVDIAIRVIFAKRVKKGRPDNMNGKSDPPPKGDDDDKYRIDTACTGCDKSSCASCPLATRDIPMPKIHELK